MESCGWTDLQASLAGSLARRDIEEFRDALRKSADATMMDQGNMCTFEQALKTHGCVKFVEACLNHGCSPNHLNPHHKKMAINFAADSRDPAIIGALLKFDDVKVDWKHAELTPLNSLAKNLTAENCDDVTACIRQLLDYGASVNVPDQRTMTPLHYIMKNKKIHQAKHLQLVQSFLALGTALDLDTYRDGELRELLEEIYPNLQLPSANNSEATDCSFEALLAHLSGKNESGFLKMLPNSQMANPSATEDHNKYYKLLEEAIRNGLNGAVDRLLDMEQIFRQSHCNSSAFKVAAIWGNWYALHKLLKLEAMPIHPKHQLLIPVIQKLDNKSSDDWVDYEKCFDLLLNSDRIDINETDPSGSTPLHYAVKYRNRKVIQQLLQNGSYIGMRSAFDDLPIDGIAPDLLEEHFDNCITTNECKPGEEEFELLMDYKNLMPNEFNATTTPQSKYKNSPVKGEMTPIAFIADSKEHRHLLQHPLITSFLFLKWHRLSVVFYLNFLFYSVFAVSMVTHIILKFRENESGTVCFAVLAGIGIVYLILREIIQFLLSPGVYIWSFINYMELALIVLSIRTCLAPDFEEETKRVEAVATILLVALELCLLVGSLPVLSISTHMLMLRAVSKTFLKSFTLYSIFVITFSLCFYVLFGKPQESGDPTAADDGEFNKFNNPLLAVIKTIVMLTGEFDAGDIRFDTFSSYFIFLLFVLFMSIVLFNLLNGLAVSDTQAIKAQAELNGSICRTYLLTRYEEVLTRRSGWANCLFNGSPFRTVRQRLINLYPNYIAGRQVVIRPNDGNKVMIPIVNPNELKNRNDQSRSSSQPLAGHLKEHKTRLLDPPVQLPFPTCCCACITGKCSQMESRTVKLAMAVIERKANALRDGQRQQNTEDRLRNIEQKLDKVFQILQSGTRSVKE